MPSVLIVNSPGPQGPVGPQGPSGSAGQNLNASNFTQSFANSNTWTVNHNLGYRYVLIQTYDTNFDEIIPQNIDLLDTNTAVISFPTLESGTAVATLGGALQYVTSSVSIASGEKRSDFTGSISYCGLAPLGSLETQEVWTINKIAVALNGSTSTTTATNVAWTDRYTVIYS